MQQLSIQPEQPEAPRLIVRIAGVCLVVGVLAIVGGSFWPVLGALLIVGAMLLIAAVILLAPYCRPPNCLDRHETRDIRKLYRDQ